MRGKTKILSFALAGAMCLGMMPVAAFAEDTTAPTTEWDDYAATAFAGGTGTKDDPYQIATAGQLAYFAKESNDASGSYTDSSGLYSFNGVYVELTADIDLSGHLWIPIARYVMYANGTSETEGIAFAGYFDGGGHTISNMYVDESTTEGEAGLFGYIMEQNSSTEEIIVQNLTIEDAFVKTAAESKYNIYGNTNAGILAGMITSIKGQRTNSIVKNVSVSGTI